jgi:hypothetical protein
MHLAHFSCRRKGEFGERIAVVDKEKGGHPVRVDCGFCSPRLRAQASIGAFWKGQEKTVALFLACFYSPATAQFPFAIPFFTDVIPL